MARRTEWAVDKGRPGMEVVMTVVAAMMSIDAMVNLIDLAFACMAIPTMISALLLSRRVMAAARVYFNKLDAG